MAQAAASTAGGAPLAWTADPPGRSPAAHLVAFRTLVLAHWTAQSWAWVADPLPVWAAFPRPAIVASALLFTLLLGLSFWRPSAAPGAPGRWACAAGTLLAGWEVAWLLPWTPNHNGLLLAVLGLCAVLDAEDEEEGPLLLQVLRWMTAIVFFYAGLQKAIHGLYFQGEFLSWMVGQGSERWADVFGWVLPGEEVQRLRSYGRFEPGAGPYRGDSLLFVLASNAVWIGEMAIGLAILVRPLRKWAALAAIALTFTIQLAPREFMFALGYTQLLLLSVPGEWNRRLLWPFLLAYAYLLGAALGWVPGALLVKTGGHI